MSAAQDAPGPPPQMINWGVAAATARRLTRPGPQVEPQEAAQVVADLRRYAAAATAPVLAHTGLRVDEGIRSPVVVVDRNGWIQANADGLAEVFEPLIAKIAASRPGMGNANVVGQVGSTLTGVEAGALLGFLSTKVLGQFDPWYASPTEQGRLLLVAPNIVSVERELGVDPADFRMWVCLHEETHRVQFTAVPWLREHLRAEVADILAATEIDPAELMRRLRELLGGMGETVRSGGASGPSLVDLVQSPEQKAMLENVTAVMSLLEGHADVVMDGVGPAIVPSVATIRARFQQRRESAAGLERTLRRLLGLEAKMAQYRDGAAFVRGVVDQVGMAGFNRVWESAAALPSLAELADPPAWVRRVHGPAAIGT